MLLQVHRNKKVKPAAAASIGVTSPPAIIDAAMATQAIAITAVIPMILAHFL